MKLTFDVDRLLLPVSVDLQDRLNEVANQNDKLTSSTNALTFNFRDTSYNAESGGWHPVEIRIVRLYDQWIFDYITDFSYCGGLFPELVKEVDFNFGCGTASFLYVPETPISDSNVCDFYQVWEMNFLSYISMNVFDEIKVMAE
ncbi:DUF2787 family protein [Photobacterium sanguinicancri]|uniref:DUF2787 domain-containing protein n=1 Tax=Photobacterium sanguinicancri TaxID=875932 RepID=A0ABX4FTC1_9GAMM|nr:DUF2787 family protein [Photobacterium sanguinicancri]OZS42114.1 hypothetical protein ASV53_20150 [Photobacterium sanguinicancri]